MRKIILCIVAIVSYSCQSSVDKSKLKKIVKSIDDTNVIKIDTVRSNELNSPLFSSNDLEIQAVSISSQRSNGNENNIFYNYKPPIKSVSYTDLKADDAKAPIDNYIQIGKRKFVYTNIYFEKIKTHTQTHIQPEISKIYEIKTKRRKTYLAVFCKDMSYNNAYWNELVFLFPLDKNLVAHPLFLDDTKFITSKFFGDYNRNGNLDFLVFSEKMDTIYCKEIIGDSIVPIEQKYLRVKTLDGIGQAFTVNTGASKWW